MLSKQMMRSCSSCTAFCTMKRARATRSLFLQDPVKKASKLGVGTWVVLGRAKGARYLGVVSSYSEDHELAKSLWGDETRYKYVYKLENVIELNGCDWSSIKTGQGFAYVALKDAFDFLELAKSPPKGTKRRRER